MAIAPNGATYHRVIATTVSMHSNSEVTMDEQFDRAGVEGG
jgi:hypothetical protein